MTNKASSPSSAEALQSQLPCGTPLHSVIDFLGILY